MNTLYFNNRQMAMDAMDDLGIMFKVEWHMEGNIYCVTWEEVE